MPRPWFAIFRRFVPSGLTSHTPKPNPVRPFDDTNAIDRPSGDQTGTPIDTRGSLSKVICRRSPLSRRHHPEIAVPAAVGEKRDPSPSGAAVGVNTCPVCRVSCSARCTLSSRGARTGICQMSKRICIRAADTSPLACDVRLLVPRVGRRDLPRGRRSSRATSHSVSGGRYGIVLPRLEP